MLDQKKVGQYDKFSVSRRDGRDRPNHDREGAEYFVLDLTYDPFALPALRAYRDACAEEYPLLAKDLTTRIEELEKGTSDSEIKNIRGKLGWAQTINVEVVHPDQTATLGNWYLHFDTSPHPLWNSYTLAVVHLREIEGGTAPTKRYPEAEYELMLLALDPKPRPNPNDPSTLKILTPQNVVVQFDVGGDDEKAKEVLRLAVVALLDGMLPAEPSDYRGGSERWTESITKTAEHYKTHHNGEEKTTCCTGT